jgi:hypothetical protein
VIERSLIKDMMNSWASAAWAAAMIICHHAIQKIFHQLADDLWHAELV